MGPQSPRFPRPFQAPRPQTSGRGAGTTDAADAVAAHVGAPNVDFRSKLEPALVAPCQRYM
eukprot:305400-Pyramimonas_sp.AAC.1